MYCRFSAVLADAALGNFSKIMVFRRFYIAGQVQACIMVCLSISATGQVVDAAQGLIEQNGMLPGNLKPDRADIPENIKEQLIVELYSK